MSYKALDEFEKAWIFKRQDPLITADDLTKILPLIDLKANQLWRDYISTEQLHPDLFTEYDWPKNEASQLGRVEWESIWDSDDDTLPFDILEHLKNWQDETRIYFCYNSDQIIETTFAVFSRCWKNFLFLDNGPLLVARKKKQAIQFFSNGYCHLLLRS